MVTLHIDGVPYNLTPAQETEFKVLQAEFGERIDERMKSLPPNDGKTLDGGHDPFRDLYDDYCQKVRKMLKEVQ